MLTNFFAHLKAKKVINVHGKNKQNCNQKMVNLFQGKTRRFILDNF